MNKDRVAAFIDAIIAIVLTVLILEIKVPDAPSLKLFFSEWRMAFSYLMTFILVMFSWYVQHDMFASLKHIRIASYVGICLWLFILSFLPITTSFVGRFPQYWGAELVYLAEGLLWLVAAQIMSATIRHDNPDVPELAAFSRRQSGPFMLGANLTWTVVATIGIFWIPELGMLTPLVTVLIQVLSNQFELRRQKNEARH